MPTDWMNGFIVPFGIYFIVSAIVVVIFFFFIRAVRTIYKESFKFFLKYKILRKPYNQKDVEWIYSAIERNMNFIEMKKLLLINMVSENRINELFYIYLQINKMKGGKNGRKHIRDSSKVESSEDLPTI